MFNIFRIFGKKSDMGATTRNAYLDNHGYYLAQQQRKPVRANGHSAPVIPYVIADLLAAGARKEFTVYVRWDIYSYRWALHTFKHTSSCRISYSKSASGNHRQFVRDGEQTPEALQSYSSDHTQKFDLMIFDGPEKNEAVTLLIPMLKENGVIVMPDDFSDPYDFERALTAFRQAGFKCLVLSNPAPLFDNLCGAVIYREKNFLNL